MATFPSSADAFLAEQCHWTAYADTQTSTLSYSSRVLSQCSIAGLGTSTKDEAVEYFSDLGRHRKEFVWQGKPWQPQSSHHPHQGLCMKDRACLATVTCGQSVMQTAGFVARTTSPVVPVSDKIHGQALPPLTVNMAAAGPNSRITPQPWHLKPIRRHMMLPLT